jgi:hypothetical protein
MKTTLSFTGMRLMTGGSAPATCALGDGEADEVGDEGGEADEGEEDGEGAVADGGAGVFKGCRLDGLEAEGVLPADRGPEPSDRHAARPPAASTVITVAVAARAGGRSTIG